MELVHLRTFLAVVEHRGFRRAARRLYLSQPAVSRQVAALERSVGVALLARTPDGVEPTAAGLVLAEQARQLLEDHDEAVRAARREAFTGDLVVAMTPGGAGELTAPLVRHLVRAFPRVHLRTYESTLLNWPDAASSEVDLVLARDPFPDDRVRATRLVTERMVLAVPPRLPESEAGHLNLPEALALPFARLSKQADRSVVRFWTLHEQREGSELHFRGSPSADPRDVGRAVGRGVGVAFATAMVVRQFQFASERSRLVPVDGAPAVRLALVSGRDDHRPLIDAVHRETEWVVRRLGPLVLPELADAARP